MGKSNAYDVRLSDNGTKSFRVPRCQGSLLLANLAFGRIQVFNLEAFEPMMWLKEGRTELEYC